MFYTYGLCAQLVFVTRMKRPGGLFQRLAVEHGIECSVTHLHIVAITCWQLEQATTLCNFDLMSPREGTDG
jgi:hypothetical protein